MLLIKNRVYQALLLAKERFLDGVYSDRDQLDDDKFDKALDDIDKLSEKYLWLRELGKEYMNEKRIIQVMGGETCILCLDNIS